MKTKKKGYKLLLFITLLFTLCAISTLIPTEQVSKVSMLGYKAHCSYTPISTIICLALAGGTCIIRKKKFIA